MSVELVGLVGLIFVGASVTISAAAIIRRLRMMSDKAVAWCARLVMPILLAIGALSQLFGSGVEVNARRLQW